MCVCVYVCSVCVCACMCMCMCLCMYVCVCAFAFHFSMLPLQQAVENAIDQLKTMAGHMGSSPVSKFEKRISEVGYDF